MNNSLLLWVVVEIEISTKRPKMANIASELSNHAIFTNDNPRTEDPDAIIEANGSLV